MNTIWVCSDWHFNHDKDFIYAERNFMTVQEMNEAIIQRHNQFVAPDDEVYMLGDACLGGPNKLEENKKLIERMNGRIHIIRGNHDTDKRIEMYHACKNVVEVCEAKYLKYGGYHFYLSHYPTLTSNYDSDKPLKQRLINICGHTHTNNIYIDMDKGPIYHCEMETRNCYPTKLDSVINFVAGVFS